MRIALTVHQFLPDFHAGTEIVTYSVSKELQRRGHEVVVIAGHPGAGELADGERFVRRDHDGLPVVRFLHAPVPMAGQTNVMEAEYCNRLFRQFFRAWLARERPDVVHFLHLGRLSASAIDACVESGVPTVFTATDFWLMCPTCQLRLPDGSLCDGPKAGAANCVKHLAVLSQPTRLRQLVRITPLPMVAAAVWAANRGLLGRAERVEQVRALSARAAAVLNRVRLVDKIVVPSQIMAQVLTRGGVPPERMVMIPYGIDRRRIRRHFDRGNEPRLRVIYVGTLSEAKGADVLIRAVRSLPAAIDVAVRLYGRMDEYPDYVRALHSMIGGDHRIELCGPVDNRDIGQILEVADVLVCPSTWYENTPLVIQEAFAAGAPVIATRLAGMSELVHHGENGMLFDKGDVRQLAGCIRHLNANRHWLQELAHSTRPPMSITDHGGAIESLYESVIRARAAQNPGPASRLRES